MIFCFRPCARRARWRRRRIPRSAVQLLAALGCLAVLIALLFLAPQWVLVVLILALIAGLLYLIKS
ncbi:MAG: hypothetical protein J5544_05140 [Clostridia bacterium]|nr:hypothetical protein [Clostridia bacterium]